jgi:hypothetical protein
MSTEVEERPPPGPIGDGGVESAGGVVEPESTAIASAWIEAAP